MRRPIEGPQDHVEGEATWDEVCGVAFRLESEKKMAE